jgi:hypothetical protein
MSFIHIMSNIGCHPLMVLYRLGTGEMPFPDSSLRRHPLGVQCVLRVPLWGFTYPAGLRRRTPYPVKVQ